MKLVAVCFIFAALLGCSANEPKNFQIQKVQKLDAIQYQTLKQFLLTGDEKVLTKGDRDCSAFIKGLPTNYLHGFVTVPEDWSKPEGATINVFYYGQLLEGKPPVVFYNGGPTSDSHGSYQVLSQAPEYENFSFLFIDQRGTGCSDKYPTSEGSETLYRLVNYGSRSIVLDSEAVRKKILGEDGKWKIFGQSYGGKIVHRYAELDLSHVVSSHAHGFSIMSDGDEWMLMRLLSQKRVVQSYLEKYPEDEKKLRDLQAAIPESRCFTNGEVDVCGPRVVDGFTIFLGFTSSWNYMHSTLKRIITEDGLNETLLTQFVRDYAIGVFAHNYVAAAVIGMADMSTGKPMFDFCTEPTKRLIERGEDPSSWVINECRLLSGIVNRKWDPSLRELAKDNSILDETTLGSFSEGLQRFPQIPFYLYAGKLDVFVPFETFEEEVGKLGSLIEYTLFEKSGHEGFHTEGQVWGDLLR